ARQWREEQQPGDACQEREGAQGQLVHAEELRRKLLRPEEERRGSLVVIERTQEPGVASARDVEGETRFVDPERSAAEVMGEPQYDPRRERPPEDQLDRAGGRCRCIGPARVGIAERVLSCGSRKVHRWKSADKR